VWPVTRLCQGGPWPGSPRSCTRLGGWEAARRRHQAMITWGDSKRHPPRTHLSLSVCLSACASTVQPLAPSLQHRLESVSGAHKLVSGELKRQPNCNSNSRQLGCHFTALPH